MAHVDVLIPAGTLTRQPATADPAAGTHGFTGPLGVTLDALLKHRDTVPFSVLVAFPAGPDDHDAGYTESAVESKIPALRVLPVADPQTAPADGSADAGHDDIVGVEARLVCAALDATDGTHAMILRPGDRLMPGALGRLVRAASMDGPAGAIGTWVACDDDGRATGPEADPPAELGRRIDLDALLDGYAPSSGAVLLDRRALGARRPAPRLGEAAWMDLLLRIVEQGDRFAVVPSVVSMCRPTYGGVQGRWSSLAESANGSLRRSFSRAATLGFQSAGVDLSDDREARASLAVTLRIATRAALADSDPRHAAATELLRPVADRDSISPELAAWAAVEALRRTEGFVPAVDGVSERLWSRSLRGWWSRFVGERWSHSSLLDLGAGLLAEQLVARTEVAKATMGDLAGLWSRGERFCVAGSGPDARAMAAHAARAGCRTMLLVPDPGMARRLTPGDIVDPSELDAGSLDVVSLNTEIGVDAPLVVIDVEGPEALAPFSARPNVIRWSSARRRLQSRAASKLAAVWKPRESVFV
ncbi:MAG: hypothetical protein AAF297_00030 [Planctomycetota bacterium]